MPQISIEQSISIEPAQPHQRTIKWVLIEGEQYRRAYE
jgi:hypothetical protein